MSIRFSAFREMVAHAHRTGPNVLPTRNSDRGCGNTDGGKPRPYENSSYVLVS
jgi:hypothetical protein